MIENNLRIMKKFIGETVSCIAVFAAILGGFFTKSVVASEARVSIYHWYKLIIEILLLKN